MNAFKYFVIEINPGNYQASYGKFNETKSLAKARFYKNEDETKEDLNRHQYSLKNYNAKLREVTVTLN